MVRLPPHTRRLPGLNDIFLEDSTDENGKVNGTCQDEEMKHTGFQAGSVLVLLWAFSRGVSVPMDGGNAISPFPPARMRLNACLPARGLSRFRRCCRCCTPEYPQRTPDVGYIEVFLSLSLSLFSR